MPWLRSKEVCQACRLWYAAGCRGERGGWPERCQIRRTCGRRPCTCRRAAAVFGDTGCATRSNSVAMSQLRQSLGILLSLAQAVYGHARDGPAGACVVSDAPLVRTAGVSARLIPCRCRTGDVLKAWAGSCFRDLSLGRGGRWPDAFHPVECPGSERAWRTAGSGPCTAPKTDAQPPGLLATYVPKADRSSMPGCSAKPARAGDLSSPVVD